MRVWDSRPVWNTCVDGFVDAFCHWSFSAHFLNLLNSHLWWSLLSPFCKNEKHRLEILSLTSRGLPGKHLTFSAQFPLVQHGGYLCGRAVGVRMEMS